MKTRLLVTALALLSGSLAQAGEFGNHPATLERSAPSLDASSVLVGHPASPLTRSEHANHEHPAVAAARLGGHSTLSADSFIVQPPASVSWKVSGEPAAVQVAHIGR